VNADDGSHRGGTLVMVTDQRFPSADPAFYNEAQRPQFIGLAYDSLVTFQQSGTTDGLRLVPDLALAIPTPTDGGSTYVFRVRRGIRYSNGAPVQADDFRRAIERLFRLGSPGRSFFAGIVGASRCAQRPSSCNLSRGMVTDDDTGSVTFHLTAPDPEFLFKLTEQGYSAPIPRGASNGEQGSSPPPSTGPYEISAAHPDSIRFTRNPFFREWSHAAQPQGNPDAIVWQHASTPALAVATVEHDRADWFFGLIPPWQHRALELRSPGQLHVSPQFGVDFAPLNTHRAPFNDVRVRRALNYAIDRAKIVQMYGGSRFATPACQPLAPGLPGYRRYCPSTLRPRSDGKWGAPDLDKAIRLVRESKTRGERVDVWGEPDTGYIPPQVPAYFARVLRSLGYRVHLHLVSYRSVTEAHREQFQLSVDGDWVAEYPDPSAYIPQFFSCGGGTSNGYYCNPRLDSEMREASRLSIAHPLQAAAMWASIDHKLADDAPWVPTVNQQEVDLVSSRLHNYEYNPVWGFLADQAWLG
jgi:peptide/nickel transport system substrate-binding protein